MIGSLHCNMIYSRLLLIWPLGIHLMQRRLITLNSMYVFLFQCLSDWEFMMMLSSDDAGGEMYEISC